jgi:hypothetical protein
VQPKGGSRIRPVPSKYPRVAIVHDFLVATICSSVVLHLDGNVSASNVDRDGMHQQIASGFPQPLEAKSEIITQKLFSIPYLSSIVVLLNAQLSIATEFLANKKLSLLRNFYPLLNFNFLYRINKN